MESKFSNEINRKKKIFFFEFWSLKIDWIQTKHFLFIARFIDCRWIISNIISITLLPYYYLSKESIISFWLKNFNLHTNLRWDSNEVFVKFNSPPLWIIILIWFEWRDEKKWRIDWLIHWLIPITSSWIVCKEV